MPRATRFEYIPNYSATQVKPLRVGQQPRNSQRLHSTPVRTGQSHYQNIHSKPLQQSQPYNHKPSTVRAYKPIQNHFKPNLDRTVHGHSSNTFTARPHTNHDNNRHLYLNTRSSSNVVVTLPPSSRRRPDNISRQQYAFTRNRLPLHPVNSRMN